VPPVPSEAERSTLTLALVGDVMLGRGVAQALDGDWGAAFVEVRPWLAEADLAFANLESPLTTVPFLPFVPPTGGDDPPLSALSIGGDEGGVCDLRAPPEAVVALDDAGFDVVSLANNHAFDAGETGARETVNILRAVGIVPLVSQEVGTLVNWEAGTSPGWSPVYQSANLPIYHLLAFDDSVTPLDVEAAVEAVAAAAKQADLVLVSVHWGGEYQAAPSSRQRAIAGALAGAGAGLIVGHGPHVLQRVEWVGGALVAYSLGNFLFDQPYPADCRWGAILRVTLRDGCVVAVGAVPTVVERGRVVPAGPDATAAILARLNLQL
jgi:poly-gamma-glutamate capsule biosynthesis protein CapA/YwtB (metallophosphatase superfamily)